MQCPDALCSVMPCMAHMCMCKTSQQCLMQGHSASSGMLAVLCMWCLYVRACPCASPGRVADSVLKYGGVVSDNGGGVAARKTALSGNLIFAEAAQRAPRCRGGGIPTFSFVVHVCRMPGPTGRSARLHKLLVGPSERCHAQTNSMSSPCLAGGACWGRGMLVMLTHACASRPGVTWSTRAHISVAGRSGSRTADSIFYVAARVIGARVGGYGGCRKGDERTDGSLWGGCPGAVAAARLGTPAACNPAYATPPSTHIALEQLCL